MALRLYNQPPMPVQPLASKSHLTLVLCTILHAFTHAYATMLVPLYLLMRQDLKLPGVAYASSLVTVYVVTYFLLSYPAGILADRYDRKWLLGLGLIGNAAAVTAMGLTDSYPLLVVEAVMAGICGTVFHPAANALIPAHYPRSPGMAIGLLGIGSGIGFFAGPQYAGWRAETAVWQLWNVSNWQRPLVEMGVAGAVVGVLWLMLASEVPHGRVVRAPLGPTLRNRVAGIASLLALREFSFMATMSLASIYLQKAHDLSPKQTGFILGAMMLVGVITNPLLAWLSAGSRRLPTLTATLLLSGIGIATIPFVPISLTLAIMVVIYAFHLAASALADCAMLERLDPAVRGRAVGVFLSIAGTVGGLGPVVMGGWTDALRTRALDVSAYILPFAAAGGVMFIAALAVPLIGQLGQFKEPAIDPLSETKPATMGVAG